MSVDAPPNSDATLANCLPVVTTHHSILDSLTDTKTPRSSNKRDVVQNERAVAAQQSLSDKLHKAQEHNNNEMMAAPPPTATPPLQPPIADMGSVDVGWTCECGLIMLNT